MRRLREATDPMAFLPWPSSLRNDSGTAFGKGTFGFSRNGLGISPLMALRPAAFRGVGAPLLAVLDVDDIAAIATADEGEGADWPIIRIAPYGLPKGVDLVIAQVDEACAEVREALDVIDQEESRVAAEVGAAGLLGAQGQLDGVENLRLARLVGSEAKC